MTDRERLAAQLRRHEGWRPSAYQDSLGYWTIGYGRCVDARVSAGITQAEAEYLLAGDIDRVTRELVGRYRWFVDLDPVRQAVLVNMGFNLGLSRLAGFRRMLSAVAAHQYGQASDEMIDSEWAKQVGARASELSAQMRTGTWAL